MPRHARQQSPSNIYHVISRGINRQEIFRTTKDREHYLACLLRYKDENSIRIFAYSLMDNHIHLLLQGGMAQVARFMHKVNGGYASYFNMKYGRVGHLFQDRYRSENVDTDSYFKIVLRYIHQNPVKIGQSITYWTSYNDYFDQSGGGLVSIDFPLSLFGETVWQSRQELKRFFAQKGEELLDEPGQSIKLSEAQAKHLVDATLQAVQWTKSEQIDRKLRDQALCQLKKSGLSIRQISQASGIGRSIVANAKYDYGGTE